MEGIPVLRVGSSLRVLRWALIELLTTGRLVRLRDAVDGDQFAAEVSEPRPVKRRRASRSRVVSIDRTGRDSAHNAEQLALLPSD